MKIEESYRRQAELEDYLKEMATQTMDDEALRAMAMKLKVLYTDGFRHNYSKFYPLIMDIFNDNNTYNADILSENLEQIRAIVEKDYFDNEDKSQCKFVGLYKPLTKLADHISLEIGRHSYSMVRESRLGDLEKRNENLQSQLQEASDKLTIVNNSLENSQKEYVAILGIFAAAVLAFTGGIAFSTSVLENIAAASIYRIIAVSLVIGVVLINVLLVLFYHIERIVHGTSNIIKPLIISNIVLIGLFACTFFAWKTGMVERRNEAIECQYAYSYVDTGEDAEVAPNH